MITINHMNQYILIKIIIRTVYLVFKIIQGNQSLKKTSSLFISKYAQFVNLKLIEEQSGTSCNSLTCAHYIFTLGRRNHGAAVEMVVFCTCTILL